MDYSEKKISYQKEQIKDYEGKLKESVEIYTKSKAEYLLKEKDITYKFDILMNRYSELKQTVCILMLILFIIYIVR